MQENEQGSAAARAQAGPISAGTLARALHSDIDESPGLVEGLVGQGAFDDLIGELPQCKSNLETYRAAGDHARVRNLERLIRALELRQVHRCDTNHPFTRRGLEDMRASLGCPICSLRPEPNTCGLHGRFNLNPTCHPGAPLRASFDFASGLISLFCETCKSIVCAAKIAES